MMYRVLESTELRTFGSERVILTIEPQPAGWTFARSALTALARRTAGLKYINKLLLVNATTLGLAYPAARQL